jgi:hypothetical protein
VPRIVYSMPNGRAAFHLCNSEASVACSLSSCLETTWTPSLAILKNSTAWCSEKRDIEPQSLGSAVRSRILSSVSDSIPYSVFPPLKDYSESSELGCGFEEIPA